MFARLFITRVFQVFHLQRGQRPTTVARCQDCGGRCWRVRSIGRGQQVLAMARDSPQPDDDEDVEYADGEDRRDAVEKALGEVERREEVLVLLRDGAGLGGRRVVAQPEHVVGRYRDGDDGEQAAAGDASATDCAQL